MAATTTLRSPFVRTSRTSPVISDRFTTLDNVMPLDKCPDTRTLEQLLLGKVPTEQFELLSDHLEKCSTCMKTAETLVPADEVTNALKVVTVLRGDEELLAEAIERGKQLGSQAPTIQPDATIIGSAAEAPAEAPSAAGFTVQNNPTELSYLAPPQQPDELGRLGSYRILQILGVGGMGIVFRAEDPALRRQVALKVMKPTVAMNRTAKDRFLREAQFTAAIEHDNIVAIYQVGEDQGVPFIAMPLLKGESLKARLERDGQLPQADVLRIGREIASGLAAAHERDLIHRDIKPDNIWLEEKTNRARILDFGLVRAASEDAGLTQSGTVMGTPRYMAPEQAMGQDVDFRCDLFSLGAVLYHLLSGKLPFEGSNVTATLMAVVQKDPLPLERVVSGLHPTLGKLIHKLMAKDREKRPKSAKEVAKLLAAIHQDLRQSASKRAESPSTANAAGIEGERREPSGVSPAETPKTVTGGFAPSRSNLLTVGNDAQQRTLFSTEPLAALPVILTEPTATISGRKGSKRTQASTDRRPPVKPPVKKRLAALGAGGIFLALLGIIVITIRNKDGKETTIRVSEGTETDVAAEPGSKVSIRQESEEAAGTPSMKAGVAAKSGSKVSMRTESEKAENTIRLTDAAALAEYFALNRRAAEKALAVGGPNSFVGLEDTAKHQWHFAQHGETLPDGPFLVRKWSIMNSTTATNADLEVLRGLRHVRDINLGTAFHRLDAGALQHIAAIRAPLEYFSFHTPIKTSDLSSLPSFQQLNAISVLGPDVDDQWAFVKKFPNLRVLNVNTGPWPDLAPLGEFPHLRALVLQGEAPDPTAVSQLQQKNPQLRILASSDGKQFRVVGQDPLRESISGLVQAGLPMKAHLFDGTSKPVQPEEVDSLFASGVNYFFCHAIPPEIRLTSDQRRQLTLLSMENLHANGQQEADLLAAALSNRTDLHSLYLQNADLTDAGLKHLEALVGLSILDVIGTEVTPAGLKAFRAAVPGCTLITSDGTLAPDYLREPAGANRSPSLTQNDWPADAPEPAIAPFDAAQAKAHQEAWAGYLGVPVEREFLLPDDNKLTLILIPPGQFVREENGQFPVKLTKPFYMGKYEVTQAQWKSVMGNNPAQFHDKPSHPVEQVSWNDLQPFLAKLNENASSAEMHFSLPTEAQWEYACRAGTTTTYSFGDSESDLSAYGWFLDNSGGTTHPVGQLKPNPFGLFDLHGNVVELCADWKEWGYYAKAPFQDPPGPQQGTSRVARSAGWEAASIYCKSGSSHAYEPEHRVAFIGFRVTASFDESHNLTKALQSEQSTDTGQAATMPQADSWKSLFDGTSFAGWQGADGGAIPDGWRIADGAITASDTKTSIATLQEFSDFELEWEFMVAAGSNGGVFYGWHGHYLQSPVDGWILTAPEYQIVDNVGHPNGRNPQSRCAAVFGLYSPSSDPSRPAGEWNTARLLIRGTNVEHWLNGEQVVRYIIGSEEWKTLIAKTPQGANPEFGQPGPGRVALQSNTGTVSYRSIRWRSLTGDSENAGSTRPD